MKPFEVRSSPARDKLVALGIGVTLSGAVWADTPLSLAVSQTLTRDSNVYRTATSPVKDVTSTTGLQLALDKSYGRQTYQASLLGLLNRYDKEKSLDNDAYQVKATVSTEVGAAGALSLAHTGSRQLQDFGDQGTDRRREVVSTSSTTLSGRYGIYGKWSATATASVDEVDYEVLNALDRKGHGLRVGLRYKPSDLVFYEAGVKRSDTNYPKYPLISGTVVGDRVDRHDVDLRTSWTVTGVSRLFAQLGWTQERHPKDRQRDFNGWTGYLNWSYTPSGKVSYSLAVDRDTNNSGGRTERDIVLGGALDLGLIQTSQSRLTTGLVASAKWEATSKIAVTATATYRLYDEKFSSFGESGRTLTNFSLQSSGEYRALKLAGSYDFARWLSFECDVETYDRTRSLLSSAFKGDAVSCNATFSID